MLLTKIFKVNVCSLPYLFYFCLSQNVLVYVVCVCTYVFKVAFLKFRKQVYGKLRY